MSQTRVQLIGDSFDTGPIFDGTVAAIDINISSNAAISGIATVGELLTPQIKTDVISNESGTGPIELKEGATLPISKTLSGDGDINITGNVTASEIQVNTISNESGTGPIELKEGAILSAGKTLSGDGDIDITGNVTIGGLLTYEDVTNIDSVGLITARSGIDITGGVLNVYGDVQKKGNTVPSAVIGTSAPSNPDICDFWTDTSGEDPILKSWNGIEWIEVGSSTPSEFAPVVNNVTLTENDPTGDRFTSQSFDVGIDMLIEGSPHSQKGLKGEVTAEFAVYPNSESVSSVAIEAFPNNNQGNHSSYLSGFDSKARVYAPDTLGRWSWYFMYNSSSYYYLYGGQPESPHGQDYNTTPYLFQEQNSYDSRQHYDKARYYPPTPNYQYHFVVTYHRSMRTGDQKVHCMRRPANGSADWSFFWPYNCRPPEYDEATNTWYTAEISGRNVYLKESTQPFTSSGGTSHSVTSGTADSDTLGIALGNGRVVVWWRHYSTGQPYNYVRSLSGQQLHNSTLTSDNTTPKFLKFEGSYFWGSYSGKLLRSSDGITWTDVSGTIPSGHEVFDIYYNNGTGLYELYCNKYSDNSNTLLTSNNGGSTWIQSWDSGAFAGNLDFGDMYIQGGLLVFQHDASSQFKEVWYPYNTQTLTLSGTGADYASFNVNDVVRPAGSTDPLETGVITSISGTSIEINSTYRYQVGDILESTFASNSQISTRYLVISATGAVTGTVGSDPGYVPVGPDTNQTLTFPVTFNTGNVPDDDLPAGTTLKVSAQATNTIGSSDFGPSNIITPA